MFLEFSRVFLDVFSGSSCFFNVFCFFVGGGLFSGWFEKTNKVYCFLFILEPRNYCLKHQSSIKYYCFFSFKESTDKFCLTVFACRPILFVLLICAT